MNDQYVSRVVSVKNTRMIFKNFRGEGGRYNRQGDRNFNVLLPEHLANDLKAEGWNVRILKPKDEDDTPKYIIPIKVNYRNGYPPQIKMISSQGSILLQEEDVAQLDNLRVEYVNVKFSPYNYTRDDGSHGVSAYLRSMEVYLEQDDFDFDDAYEFDRMGYGR